MRGRWVIGSLFSNVWSFTGDKSVNLFSWQPFVNYNLNHGWYLSSSPVITANWKADSDNTWTVPLGGGFGRVFLLGRLPGMFHCRDTITSRNPTILARSGRSALRFSFDSRGVVLSGWR